MSRSCASLKKPGVWDEVVLKSFLYGTCEQDRETKRGSVCEGKAVTGQQDFGLQLSPRVSHFDFLLLGLELCLVLECLGVTEL